MKNTIRAYRISPDEGTHGPVDIVDDLDVLYRSLGCTCIDIVTRSIGSTPYDIVCDDEGLMTDAPYISALDSLTHQPVLVGRLLLCRHDDAGNLASLTDDDIRRIRGHIRYVSTFARPKRYPCLIDVTY